MVTDTDERGSVKSSADHEDRTPSDAAPVWAALDEPWREAFRQAWRALQSGNTPVGLPGGGPDSWSFRQPRVALTIEDTP